jgi:cytochrome c biogenesis protein CcmG/thiol:disulfide interchange protein DsbE
MIRPALKYMLAFAPLVLLVLLLAVLAWFNFHKRDRYEPRAMVGKSVPVVALTDLQDGTQIDLKSLAAGYSHPILVNVFASWCEPCRGENPLLMELKQKGVTIVGVAWKDDAKNTLNYLSRNDDPYARTLSDSTNEAGLALGISGVPETFVVAPDGRITDKVGGPIVPATLGEVETALAKAK